MKLNNTKIIKGTITVETGLHIGGSKSSLDIGGLDTPVIKTPTGVPYIPGSSLKGKIRSLLAMKIGKKRIEEEPEWMQKMFGYSDTKNKENDQSVRARLIFRDAHLDIESFNSTFEDAVLETNFTEGKYENTIDRSTGKAAGHGPRQIERVPVGAKFNFEIIINAFDGDNIGEFEQKLSEGMKMLESNYLGGSGTRGYGKVSFQKNNQ